MRSSLSWLRGSSRQGRKVHDRVRVISCSRMSAARTASSRSRRTNLSTATILRCTSSCGTSIFRSSIPGLNTIRMFVPLATRSKWRWDGGWLTAHARNSGRTTTGFARRMRTGRSTSVSSRKRWSTSEAVLRSPRGRKTTSPARTKYRPEVALGHTYRASWSGSASPVGNRSCSRIAGTPSRAEAGGSCR